MGGFAMIFDDEGRSIDRFYYCDGPDKGFAIKDDKLVDWYGNNIAPLTKNYIKLLAFCDINFSLYFTERDLIDFIIEDNLRNEDIESYSIDDFIICKECPRSNDPNKIYQYYLDNKEELIKLSDELTKE